MAEDEKTETQKIERASRRALGMFVLGASLGLPWGIVRGVGNLWTYPLFIGGNCAFASLPSFLLREAIGTNLPDTAASVVSGAIGGAVAMAAFAGPKSSWKGALAFGLAGLATERSAELFEQWRVRRREELIRLREESKTNP